MFACRKFGIKWEDGQRMVGTGESLAKLDGSPEVAQFIIQNKHIIPSVILGSMLTVVVSSITMLALSSLSKSSRYAALLYTGAIFFTDALFGALRLLTGNTSASWVSISANLTQVSDVIFRQPPRYDTPWIVSLMVLLALVALSVSVLERRVRGVEVVS